MFKRPKAKPLVLYIVAAIAALAIPLFVIAAILTQHYVDAEQKRLEEAASDLLGHIASTLDHDTAAQVAMLRALSTSPALASGDYAAFDKQAREVTENNGASIVLWDAEARPVVNTQFPAGAAVPQVLPGSNAEKVVREAARIVRETRKPYISGLLGASVLAGDPARRFITCITIPVLANDKITAFLTVSAPAKRYATMLSQTGLAAPYFASIADRNGNIVARSFRSDEFTGKKLPGFGESFAEGGKWLGTNPEGLSVLGFYKRIPDSGWFVSMGVEKAAIEAPLKQSLLVLAGIFLALLVIGAAVSVRLTHIITTSFQGLGAIATRLDAGDSAKVTPTSIREANVIGAAIDEASRKLRGQADELLSAKHDLEARVEDRTRELAAKTALMEVTLENMSEGLFMVDGGGRIAVHNRRAREMLDLPASLMRENLPLTELVAFQQASGEFAKVDGKLQDWIDDGVKRADVLRYVRERPNGTVIEVRSMPIPTGGFVRTFNDVTDQHHATQRVTHMAHHDALTGLANRVLFRKRLEQAFVAARDEGRAFSVLLMDLDRFKLVNDSLGHSAGDALIKVVAQRLSALMGEGDTIARLGGDEFAIIRMAGENHEQDAIKLADSILECLRSRVRLDGRDALTTASIGIALAPGHGADAESILKNADLALYRAKAEGRNRFRFFEAGMGQEASDLHMLEIDLRHGLARDEFEMYYQPVINAADQTTCGFEALIRWHHSERGMISPAVFIPLAEDTGVIVALGEWVLRQACIDAASWPDHIKIAVNLSPVQLRSSNLVAVVVSALAESGLSPTRLELEITETVLLEKDGSSLAALHALQDMGIGIVLDDFGTGYSSLSYVRAFPFDKIKIDKSFVDDMETRLESSAIICAVTGMARTLNMTVTAEGVETDRQFELLRAAGCGQAQGYLFSRPRPLSELSFDVETGVEEPRLSAMAG